MNRNRATRLIGTAIEQSTDNGQSVLKLLYAIVGRPPSVYREDFWRANAAYLDAIPEADSRPFCEWHGKLDDR